MYSSRQKASLLALILRKVSLSLFYSCRSIYPKQASNRAQQEWNSRDLWTERNANQGKWTPYEESQLAYRASWTSREGRVQGACKKHQRGNRWGLPQRSLDFLKEDSGDPESFPYLMEDGSLTGEQGMGQEGVWPADVKSYIQDVCQWKEASKLVHRGSRRVRCNVCKCIWLSEHI